MGSQAPRGGSLLPTRGSVWKIPYSAHERLIISEQARYDVRYIPLVWYWALEQPESGPGGTAQHEVLWESPRAHRRYADPIPVHIYSDPTTETKGMKKGVVETDGIVQIGFSRAEARRVGRLIKTVDEPEATIITEGFADPEFDLGDGDIFVLLPEEGLPTEEKPDFLFIPRPGDIFRFRGKDYEVLQVDEEYVGVAEFIAKWTGTAAQVREDSSAPRVNRKAPPTEFPEVLRPGRARWRR